MEERNKSVYRIKLCGHATCTIAQVACLLGLMFSKKSGPVMESFVKPHRTRLSDCNGISWTAGMLFKIGSVNAPVER